MPRFYTTNGAIYDLSREQAQDLQDIWNVHGGEVTAAFAAREMADYQMAPPVQMPNADPAALQRINAALARIDGTRVTTANLDEFVQEFDEHRQPELQEEAPPLTRADVQHMDVAELEQRINANIVFNTPLTRTNTANRWQQLFDDHQVEKEMEKLKPLTYPLTPEVNPDGVKRLYKTRYSELEGMYSDLHYKYNKNLASFDVQTKMFNDSRNKLQTTQLELQRVKANFVDGEIVSKRLHQICKEVGIPVPNERLNMQQQMDAFLGSVMSMIRVDLEGLDELAE